MPLWSRVAWIAATITLVGCTPNTAPSISPAPTYSCTPEAGGPIYRCTQTDYDRMKRQDALYAEGEDVFRRYIAENERVDRAGGGTELTPVYLELLGTDALRKGHVDSMTAAKADGMVVRGGTAYQVPWFHRRPGVSRNGSQVALEGCIDNSDTTLFQRGQRPSKGGAYVETLFMKLHRGRLRITAITAREVETCSK